MVCVCVSVHVCVYVHVCMCVCVYGVGVEGVGGGRLISIWQRSHCTAFRCRLGGTSQLSTQVYVCVCARVRACVRACVSGVDYPPRFGTYTMLRTTLLFCSVP